MQAKLAGIDDSPAYKDLSLHVSRVPDETSRASIGSVRVTMRIPGQHQSSTSMVGSASTPGRWRAARGPGRGPPR